MMPHTVPNRPMNGDGGSDARQRRHQRLARCCSVASVRLANGEQKLLRNVALPAAAPEHHHDPAAR
jgi:hypothetical protein